MDRLTRRAGGDSKEEELLPMHSPLPETGTLNPRKNSKRSIPKIRFKQLIYYFILWFCVLIYFERIQVKRLINACDWGTDESYHVTMVADPQIVDDYSYPGRPKWANYIAKKFSDNYLHRNYMLQKKILKPDLILFVGDLFDGGREWADDVWYDEYLRFNKIFPQFTDTKNIMSLPGNHDVGFGNGVNITILNRFRTFFGESNDYVIMGGFCIVMVDTVSLSSTDPLVRAEPVEFLKRISQPDHEIRNYPTILMTHVPLYRFTEQQTCGPLRESKKKFPVMRGVQYQTVLEHELSQELLQIVQPVLIFGGDDHDYCEITHSYIHGGVNRVAKEITIKAASLSGGIKYPAFQLLSLDESTKSYYTSMCYMPTPFNMLTLYVVVLLLQILSFVIILGYPSLARNLEFKWGKLVQTDKKLLPVDIGDEKPKTRKVKLLDTFKNFIKLSDWEIPELKSWSSCMINIGVLILGEWFILLWFFNSI